MANLIGDHMQAHGINFIRNSIPKRVEKLNDGKLEVIYDSYEWGEEHADVYDTVVLAVGKMHAVPTPYTPIVIGLTPLESYA